MTNPILSHDPYITYVESYKGTAIRVYYSQTVRHRPYYVTVELARGERYLASRKGAKRYFGVITAAIKAAREYIDIRNVSN